MPDQPALADLQQWMLGAVCDPGTAAAPEVDRMIAPSPTLTARECMDLYRRGYRMRLLECLQAMHPALRHLLGAELFDGFALDYLAVRPSTSYTLFDLDAGLAAHLAATRPASPTERWPELIIDVVRFERAFLEVYDGEGVEGQVVASSLDVPAYLPPAAVLEATAVPCLRMLRSEYPVGDYVLAVRRGERPSLPPPRPTYLALVRRDFVVQVVPLAADSYAALQQLLAGNGTARRLDDARLDWIAAWADQGMFKEVRVLEPVQRGTPCC